MRLLPLIVLVPAVMLDDAAGFLFPDTRRGTGGPTRSYFCDEICLVGRQQRLCSLHEANNPEAAAATGEDISEDDNNQENNEQQQQHHHQAPPIPDYRRNKPAHVRLMDPSRGSTSNDKSRTLRPFSRSKWKKKRFLMMNDIKQLIDKGDPRAPHKAEEMVRRMHRLSEIHQDVDLRPTEQAYNHWINALAKCSRKPTAGQEAEKVLNIMGENGVKPSVVSYTMVMDAYAQSSRRNNNAAQEAERVLYELLDLQQQQPDIVISSITCDTVLKAWARKGTVEGAERAQQILERLEQMQNANIRPTAHSYSTVIHAWARCKGGVPAAERAEELLERMLLPPLVAGAEPVRPDTVVFNSCIHAWSNSNDPRAGTRSVALLQRMRELHNPSRGYETSPDIVTYNSVLAAWSRGDDDSAAPQTERVIKDMKIEHEKSPETNPKPNTISFNSVLHAWSKSSLPGAVDRAQAVLDYMIRSDPKDGISPDVISFASVLNAVAKSKEPDKAKKARKLLDSLIDMYQKTNRSSLKPSTIPYNTVLNACAFTNSDEEEQREALQIAVSTFSAMRAHPWTSPDTVTYGNLMKCFANLVPQGEKRDEMAMKLFQKCCDEGLVGELVWNEVRRAVESNALNRVVGTRTPVQSLKLRDLPRQWTNSVHGDKLAAKRRARKQTITTKTSNPRDNGPVQRYRSISEPSYQSGKDV